MDHLLSRSEGLHESDDNIATLLVDECLNTIDLDSLHFSVDKIVA